MYNNFENISASYPNDYPYNFVNENNFYDF